MSTPDFSEELTGRLGNDLDRAAEAIDHGDSTTVLADVREVVGRRRRRRQVVAGVAAVGALVASGAVVATLTSSNGTDELVLSAPVTDPADTPSDTSAPDDTTSTGDGASPDEAPPLEDSAPEDGEPEDNASEAGAPEDGASEDGASEDGAQPVVPAPEASGAPSTGGAFPVRGASVEYFGDELSGDELINGFPTQVVAWDGGFLSITSVSEPQTLPTELPPEIAEQFPPEVNDLFPDGLPPTIAEATERLEEAGLYDIVSEIVLANPDVYDAIYGQPVNVLSTVRFSTDGGTWEEIDADIPSEALQGQQLVAAGDRLVSASLEGDSVVVRSSTDLIEWNEQVIPALERPADLAEVVRFDVSVGQIAGNADRWLLQVSTFGGFDPGMGLEGELGEQVRNGQADYEFAEDGVRFTVLRNADYEDLPADEIETTVVPWSEWGLEEEPVTEPLSSGAWYSASWGGPVEKVNESSDERVSGNLLALRDGFVDLGEPLRVSSDGIEWVELTAPFDGYVSWGIETDAGFLVSVTDEIGRTGAYAHDLSDDTWTEVDLSDVPSDSYQESTSSGVALLTHYEDPFEQLVAAQVMTAEVDGYRFEQRVERGDAVSSTYTLTEIETGAVVSTETLSGEDEFGSEFEFAVLTESADEVGRSGFEMLDPATGELLVVIPFESMTWTRLGIDGEEISDEDLSGSFEQEQEPIVWIIAAAGDGAVVEQLDVAGEMRYPVGAASNGELVLVGFTDGTFARIPLT